MKPTRFILAVAAIALPVFTACGAEPSSEQIILKYVKASDLYDLIKQEFGSSVVSPTTPVDIRLNSLEINPADTQAKKVRELIAKVDRPVRR